MSEIYFVSSNDHKYNEVRHILNAMNIPIQHHKTALTEIQSESLHDIASYKAASAHKMIQGAVIVEDAGLFIDGLNGFPGPYSAFVFDTIGNRGILDLVKDNRHATFRSVVAYNDGATSKRFAGCIRGTISKRVSGTGWGYDPIFIPDGYNKTLAQIDKDSVSHRYMALKSFAVWFESR